jgi:hypothetical protein
LKPWGEGEGVGGWGDERVVCRSERVERSEAAQPLGFWGSRAWGWERREWITSRLRGSRLARVSACLSLLRCAWSEAERRPSPPWAGGRWSRALG